ncbi:MAG: CvpA family protein [Geminicoccaceae bacterium]
MDPSEWDRWLRETLPVGLTLLDLAVIAVVLISVALAINRGVVRELLVIAAWVGAGLAGYFFYEPVQTALEPHLDGPAVLVAATAILVFLVPLLVLKIVGYRIARAVEDSPAGGLDRLLGIAFGALRGAALACLGYFALITVLPGDEPPGWIKEARLKPYLDEGLAMIDRVLPDLPEPTEESEQAAMTMGPTLG